MASERVNAAMHAAIYGGAVACVCWGCGEVFAVGENSDALYEARRQHAYQHAQEAPLRVPPMVTVMAAREVNPQLLLSYFNQEERNGNLA